MGRPLLHRSGAHQVPGGPFWRGGGSWGAVGGEPWSPLPMETGFLRTDGLSARPWVRARRDADCERPWCGMGRSLGACQELDFRPESLWRTPRFTTGAVTQRGALASAPRGGCRPGPLGVRLPRVAPSHVSPGRCFWPGVSCHPLEHVVNLERPWGLSCLLDRPRGPCPRCVPRGLGTPGSLSCVSWEVGPKGLCGLLLPLAA